MSAYLLVDVLEITDEDKFEEYRSQVFATVEQYGGAYRILGGRYDVLEGDWSPTFPVLIEFPDYEQAKRWYESPEYGAIIHLRHEGARVNGVLFEGLPEG